MGGYENTSRINFDDYNAMLDESDEEDSTGPGKKKAVNAFEYWLTTLSLDPYF